MSYFGNMDNKAFNFFAGFTLIFLPLCGLAFYILILTDGCKKPDHIIEIEKQERRYFDNNPDATYIDYLEYKDSLYKIDSTAYYSGKSTKYVPKHNKTHPTTPLRLGGSISGGNKNTRSR